MSLQPQIDSLRSLSPDASLIADAGIDYIYLPKLRVKTGNDTQTVDALLCPAKHSGYTTRLFLEKPIQKRGKNWSVHSILGRTWHTWSWNNVPENLSLMQILSAHMRPLL